MIWYLNINQLGSQLPWNCTCWFYNVIWCFISLLLVSFFLTVLWIILVVHVIESIRLEHKLIFMTALRYYCAYSLKMKSLFEAAIVSICAKKPNFCGLLREKLLSNAHHIHVPCMTSINPDMFLARSSGQHLKYCTAPEERSNLGSADRQRTLVIQKYRNI